MRCIHVNNTHFIQVSQHIFHLSYTFFTHQFQRCCFCRKLHFKTVFFFSHETKSWISLEEAMWHHKKFSSVSSPENIIIFIVDYNSNNKGALPPHASHNRHKHILMSILQILSEKKWATRNVLEKMQHFM